MPPLEKEIADILGKDLDFPVSASFDGGLLLVKSSDISIMDALLMGMTGDLSPPGLTTAAHGDMLNNLGSFMAMVSYGTLDNAVVNQFFPSPLMQRSTLFLRGIFDYSVHDPTLDARSETEKTFLRNLIHFGDVLESVDSIATLDVGINQNIARAMGTRYPGINGGCAFFDLNNRDDRIIAIEELGCDIPEMRAQRGRDVDFRLTHRRGPGRGGAPTQ